MVTDGVLDSLNEKLGLTLAWIHFVAVELRPWFLIYISGVKLLLDIATRSYRSQHSLTHDQCVMAMACTYQEVDEDFTELMWRAITSFDLKFAARDRCALISMIENNNNFSGFIFAAGSVVLAIPILYGLFLFLIARCNSDQFTFNSGAYFVFTIKLQRNTIYRIMIRVASFSIAFFWLFGVARHIQEHNASPVVSTFRFAKMNFIGLAVLVYSIYSLLDIANDAEFYEWDEALLGQVRFKRKWYTAFIKSNKFFYTEILTSCIAFARNGPGAFDNLCQNDFSSERLCAAVSLHRVKDKGDSTAILGGLDERLCHESL